MLIDVILYLVPNAEVAVYGEPTNENEYATQVKWFDDRPQPTWDEIKNASVAAENDKIKNAIQQKRFEAYRIDADPLFFGWQRGENTEQEWLDKVAEIRASHPYPA